MTKVTGGYLIARTLAEEGVKYLFTISSGTIIGMYDACEDLGIKVIHARHEASAAFMADAWSRATGELGVCAVTLGPGATNTVTGLMTAELAASPMLVIAGQAATHILDVGYCQSYDVMPMMRSVSKYAKTVLSTERLPEYVSTAFRQALTGRAGPVFLEVPYDVMYGQVEEDHVQIPLPGMYRTSARSRPDENALAQATELLKTSRKPIVIAGGGIWWSQAHNELQSLAESFRMPVFLARMARGAIPEDHPQYFGVGYIGNNVVLEHALAESDTILMVGHRWDYDLNYGRPPGIPAHIKTIQIDIEPEEIGRNRPVDIGIISDAKVALTDLAAMMTESGMPDWTNWVEDLSQASTEFEAKQSQYFQLDEQPMHPWRFLKGVRDALTRDTIVVTGHGEIDFWADPFLKVYSPGHYLRAGQSGSMGAEIPYGVAAKLANPDKPVLVIVGDGAFGYHAFELDTAARYDAPIVIVIGNDSAWGAIRQQQIQRGHKLIATDLVERQYELVAEALGGYGESVTDPDEITPAIKRAFESGKPAVINVTIKSVRSPYMQWFGRGH